MLWKGLVFLYSLVYSNGAEKYIYVKKSYQNNKIYIVSKLISYLQLCDLEIENAEL